MPMLSTYGLTWWLSGSSVWLLRKDWAGKIHVFLLASRIFVIAGYTHSLPGQPAGIHIFYRCSGAIMGIMGVYAVRLFYRKLVFPVPLIPPIFSALRSK